MASKDKGPNLSKTSDQAQTMIQEAMDTGMFTLGNGEKVKLSTVDLVRLIQWAAAQGGKKVKLVSAPEDFDLRETQ